MTHPKVVLALLGVGAILALTGPFGTAGTMPWPARIAYWGAVPALTYGIGYLIHTCAWPFLAARLTPALSRAVIVIATGLAICATVFGLNALVFGLRPDLASALILFAITLLVSAMLELLPRDTPATPDTPPLLDRLPLDKRGPLISLSVEDHYVRIRTTKGEEMVLLRLSDAIREVGGTEGLRVHRSHWVALDKVTAVARKGDGALLSMAQGPDIPVSRANMAAIRTAGLLPK
ncbi:MAG: LytTR family DNA-binding domain-containing protein [Gymnodinialimonas sp.]